MIDLNNNSNKMNCFDGNQALILVLK
ncbi:unnamed protein product, partial [Rotaria sordida]